MKPSIHEARRNLAALKPRSHRRVEVQRDLKMMVVKQLRKEIREDRRANKGH